MNLEPMDLDETELEGLGYAIDGLTHPKRLMWVITTALEYCDSKRQLNGAGLLSRFDLAGPNDTLRSHFHHRVATWDAAEDGTWLEATPPNSPERRRLVLRLLELSSEDAQLFNRLFPQSPVVSGATKISKNDGWQRWYTGSRRKPSYYWDSYQRYLREVKRWDSKNLAALDNASTNVIERLCDPFATNLRPTKGLVIGHVQSGKTANFTGVIAKAADAGYRLVIVLAGTQNLLRDQTQRRLDKELLGKEFVAEDYEDAARDWDEFVSHGVLPSQLNHFDWARLTTATQDFRSLTKGLTDMRLMFQLFDKAQPFRSRSNSGRAHARLAVVKKHPESLKSLIESLTKAAKHVQLEEIPAIVIDDESDQASVNTIRPKANEAKRRKTINGLIVELLGKLKNAQYVGYTATPFANVFIDPEDAEDLFPGDFIVSLPKPLDYMGVSDFTDEKFSPEDRRSNQWAHVRKIRGRDEEPGNLDRAIDAYVLAGAIKVFRERRLGVEFRHHTMLVHSSPRTTVHASDAKRVRDIFEAANYLGLDGAARLQKLWQADFEPRCRERAQPEELPESWDAIHHCVGEAHRRIMTNSEPVLVLNGTDSETTPNFDSESVWKIIVGGAKLSRGYTVEGLSVSYYRRTAGATDTLLQMGRWFGFRPRYRDLVRLYIGVDEPVGKQGKKINLYEAFEAACRDEEEFRAQLSRYASLADDEGERLTPRQVPPLVASHLLLPTAKNKMFNAVQAFVNFGGSTIARTSAAILPEGRRHNIDLLRDLLSDSNLVERRICLRTVEQPGGSEILDEFDSFSWELNGNKVIEFLQRYKWHKGGQPRDWPLVIEFINGMHGNPQIESWLMLAPQTKTDAKGALDVHGCRLRIRERALAPEGNRFSVFTEPGHVRVAKWISGLADGTAVDIDTQRLRSAHRATILLYAVIAPDEMPKPSEPSIGFALYLPSNGIRTKVAFRTRDPSRPDAVVVEASA